MEDEKKKQTQTLSPTNMLIVHRLSHFIPDSPPTEVGIISPILQMRKLRLSENESNIPMITQLVKWWQNNVSKSTPWVIFEKLLNFVQPLVELLETRIPDCPGLLNSQHVSLSVFK